MLTDITDKIPNGYGWIARAMLRDGYAEEEILAAVTLHRLLDVVGFDLSGAADWPHAPFPRYPTREHETAWRDVLDTAIREHPDLRMLALAVAERLDADRDHLRHKFISAGELVRRHWPDPSPPLAP